MTDYNLPFSGNEVRDGLTRVVSPDLSPQSPSTKMVTSEGIKSALDAKIDSSALVTNFSSPNNTTVPSTQAVQNFINTSADDVTTITRSGNYFTSSNSPTDIPNTIITGSRITKDSNNLYTIDPGAYAVFVRYEAYGSGSQGIASFSITSSASDVHGITFTINGGKHNSYVQEKYNSNALYESGNDNTFNVYFWEKADYYDQTAFLRNLSISFYRLG